jgi:phosphoglycolate phosphatase
MNFDGLIFDLDGTLWDCSKASAHAFNLAYERFGIDRHVSEDFVKSISGKPSSECDDILLSGIPELIRKEVSQCFDKLEIEAVQEHAPTALYEGVSEGLAALKQHYSLHVVSNCGERYLNIFHQHTSVGSLFMDLECFGRTKQFKSKNIELLVERQKLVAPCYIGDTAGDEDAASKAGVPFFHAKYGFGVPDRSPLAFASFGELTRYFLELSQSSD